MFAVFAHFAVKITTDTPVEKHEPQTTRTARTRKNRPYTLSRFSRISRLKLQRTLRLKSMNREQRERREQGETDFTNFRSFRVFHGSLLGTLHFTTEGMKEAESFRKRLLSTGDTPFFIPFNAGETPRRIRHPRGGKILPEATSCLLGTLRLRQTFAVFAYFTVKITRDTPFFLHGFRVGGEAKRAIGERVSRTSSASGRR